MNTCEELTQKTREKYGLPHDYDFGPASWPATLDLLRRGLCACRASWTGPGTEVLRDVPDGRAWAPSEDDQEATDWLVFDPLGWLSAS